MQLAPDLPVLSVAVLPTPLRQRMEVVVTGPPAIAKASQAARKAVEDQRHQDGLCDRDCPHCGPECRECGGSDWIHEKGCSRGEE